MKFICGALILAALYKPDGAGGLKRREGGATDGKLDVRPIAMPETLFRITALCGLAACKKDIVAELTKHQQMSVGVSSAAEGIITAVRLYMEEVLSGGDVEEAAEPLLRALLNADASNAFNSIDRGVMLAELKAVAPGLLPLARMVYSRPGRLVLPNHGAGEEHFRVFWSLTGARQGDPLGPLLYALGALAAMRKVQAAHPDVHLPSFVDDVNGMIVGRGLADTAKKVDAVFETLKTEFAAIGVHFNLKTAVYCPAATAAAAAAASGSYAAGGALPIKCGIRQAVDGTKVLGAPVGTTQYQVDIARKRLSTSMVQITLLPQLDFGDAMLILRKSIVPRARYLASVMPPDALVVVATEWDAAIEDCLTSMFGSAPHPRCFPSGPGCLGISKMVAELALDRVNGWARSKEVVVKHLPRLAPLTVIPTAAPIAHPVHVEVMDAWSSLPASVRTAEGVLSPLDSPPSPNTAPPPSTNDKAAVEDPRHKLTKAFSQYQRDEVRRSLDPLGTALLDASASPGARAWLDAVPGVGVQALRGDLMRVAVSLWLGMPIPELAHEQDPLGRARCRLDHSGQNARHRGLVEAVGDLLIEAGFRVWTEVVGLYGKFPESMPAAARGRVVHGEQRRMDLVAVSVALEAFCVDPTLIDPVAPSQRARLSPLDAAEAHKAEHYADTPAPYKFFPCAVGPQTELGKSAKEFLAMVALRRATRRNGGKEPSATMLGASHRHVRVKVGRAVMAHLAWQVCSGFLNSPSAALKPAQRYKHSAGREMSVDGRPEMACTCGAATFGGPPRECFCRGGLQ